VKKTTTISMALAFVATMAMAQSKPAAAPAAATADPVIISAGDCVIKQSEFESALKSLPPEYQQYAQGPGKKQFADDFLRMKMLAAEGMKNGLDKDADVQKQLSLMKENLVANAQLQKIDKSIKVSDEELKKVYDASLKDYEQVKASHILIAFKGSPAAQKDKPELTEEQAKAAAGSMIVFEAVTKVYEPDVTALDKVSFGIDKGEFVFVVGASGSGKTTLARLLLKELEPSEGRIVLSGRDIGRLRHSHVPRLRRNIGCVFQDFKLLPRRTAAENVAYALKVQGESRASIRRKVPEVMTMVGLANKMNSLPDELSGGEQQRVSIARAVVNHPPLLVCDEPTGNLDPDTSVGIMQLLYRINRAGTTILMVTHDREMVDKMRKRVIALEDGRLARDERRGGYTSE